MLTDHVTGVLVTTGETDIEPVVDSMKTAGLGEIIVYNNRERENYRVYGRYYAALHHAKYETIYVQDDDCLVPVKDIIEAHMPGELTCNMPADYRPGYMRTGISLVGFGAVFNRNLIDFKPYTSRYPADELFYRECDRIFTYLNQSKKNWVDFGVQHLPVATADSRMWKEHRHGADLRQIRKNLAGLPSLVLQ